MAERSARRNAIVELHKRGHRQCDIVRMLRAPQSTVSTTLKRYRELGHEGDRPGRGRKRSVATRQNKNKVRQRIKRNPRLSLRKVARDMGINRESLRQLVKNDLGLKAYKLRKGQQLTNQNKRVRLTRCRELVRRAAGSEWETILFTDEKLFTVEQVFNHQNDRIWSAEAPASTRMVQRRQKPKALMVWGGICASGKTPLIFIEEGVKINSSVYRRDILEAVVLPWSQRHFGDRKWIFQQDSAPAHKARESQEWCKAHFPDFITSREWPPYSPDLNPMDYSVWSILETRACATPHSSLDSLREALLLEWARITPKETRRIAENFTTRLKLCIKARGGHFENL